MRQAEGLSFRDALERLGGQRDGRTPPPGQAGQAFDPPNGGGSFDRLRTGSDGNQAAPFSERLSLDDRMILTAASAVYHETLLRTPKALQYLEERGIGLAVARRCRLGYSDGRSLRRYLQRRRLSLRRATGRRSRNSGPPILRQG